MPPKKVLVQKLKDVWVPEFTPNADPAQVRPAKNLLKAIDKRMPDAKWLVTILGIFARNDEIFS